METARESELQGRQHAWWWPLDLDTMACSTSSDLSNSDGCFLQLQWDPLLVCLGLGVVGVPAAGDDHRTVDHELALFFPKFAGMEWPGSSGAPEQDDATVMPEDQLDELLRNLWDAEEEEEQQLAGFNSSCILKEKIAAASSFLDDDGLLALCPASPADPALPAKPVAGPQPAPPSSSSSRCSVATQAGDDGQATTRANCSSKRPATRQGTDEWSGKRSRKAACSGAGASVVRPFTVVKPGGGGVDGVATLADINERILSRPTRPVPHPVGEFACAPRALAGGDNRPAPSGKPVTGFTRLHTAGKGTITIIRTSG